MIGPIIAIVVVALIGLILVVFPACVISGRISEKERRQEAPSRSGFAQDAVAGSNNQIEDDR